MNVHRKQEGVDWIGVTRRFTLNSHHTYAGDGKLQLPSRRQTAGRVAVNQHQTAPPSSHGYTALINLLQTPFHSVKKK